MKSVLMIAYWFPPEGNAATYRPLRFVRHLPQFGWDPIVLTVETSSYERYDPALLAAVPGGTTIARVPQWDPWEQLQAYRGRRAAAQVPAGAAPNTASLRTSAAENPARQWIRGAVRRLEALCYHPDMRMAWIRPAAREAARLCTQRSPRVIWSTGMPWSSFIVAERASRKSGVPYILDFRSSWTVVIDQFDGRRPEWARRRDRATLRRLFRHAQSAIFAYHAEAECFYRMYRDVLDPANIHVIPNGFEGDVAPFDVPKGDVCSLVYAGTLASYRYDTLLDGIAALKRSEPERARVMRFHFVGEGSSELWAAAAQRGIQDMVTVSTPVSHADADRLQKSAHTLIMLERVAEIKGYELLAGAKLFGYLKMGRPILGVLPDGEAKRILKRVGSPTVADVGSPDEVVRTLRRISDAWHEDRLAALVPDPEECAAYSAPSQTAALVRALDGAAAAEPFVPGACDVPPSLREHLARHTQPLRRTESRAVLHS